jgi:hypothetical protein
MWQRNMRAKKESQVPRDNKEENILLPPSVDQFVLQTIVPLFKIHYSPDAQQRSQEIAQIPNIDKLDPTLPASTSFIFDEIESATNMVTQLQQDCPSIMQNEDAFIATMRQIFKQLK